MTEYFPFDKDRPLIMAHWSNPLAAPQNTLEALRSGVEAGADVLETDLRLTKDNELVLFHDDNMLQTSGIDTTVRDLTLDEFLDTDICSATSYDGGDTFPFSGWGAKGVSLRDALSEFPEMVFNLDMKDSFKEVPDILTDLIRELGREQSVIVASYNDAQIDRFRHLMPSVPTSACPSEVSRFVFAVNMRLTRAVARNPQYRVFQVPLDYGRIKVLDTRFVEAAHKRNIAVHAWTINDRETMEHLLDVGVDGIFTDDPKMLRELLADRGLLT
ncbi:MAG: glycerophosphodiester phosphodiesterase [Candidatus Thorarchaeota archaeon]|nr:MAG: glycerophosphodiester phosphodiesterase [Candidatus Thorarchaeota archaeon]